MYLVSKHTNGVLMLVVDDMIPTRGPFGIGMFKQYKDWLPYFKVFRNTVLFFIFFEIFDLQNDGFIMLTLCLWNRCLQIQIPFPGDTIKTRMSWRFPKRNLLTIQEPKN